MPKVETALIKVPNELLGLPSVVPHASKPRKAPKPEERPVLHPVLKTMHCYTGGEYGPLTAAEMKQYLGWWVEGANTDHGTTVFGDEYLTTTLDGFKVRCLNNARNRRFDEATCNKYVQDLLERHWAGPTCFPGETVNGETGIITRTGQVVSLQHRGVALIRATERWEKEPKWRVKPYWPDGPPVLDIILVLGVSDSPHIIKTLDNVRVRTFSDNVYQSDTFRDLTDRERWECSRMYDSAVQMLWARTGAGDRKGDKVYRTNSTLDEFASNHKTLEKLVRYLYDCNKDRSITDLRLPAGGCAAVAYLMGSGQSDGDKYRLGSKEGQRVEKGLDWSSLERAKEFFAELVTTDCGSLQPVKYALAKLIDADTGQDGRLSEKLAILALAWNLWNTGLRIDPKDLSLKHCIQPDSKGRLQLVNPPVFGSLDLGPDPEPQEPDIQATPEKEAPTVELPTVAPTASNGQKASAPASDEKTTLERYQAARKAHKGKVLLFKGKVKVNVYEKDVKTVQKYHDVVPKIGKAFDDLDYAAWPADHVAEIVATLKGAKLKVAVCTAGKDGEIVVEDRVLMERWRKVWRDGVAPHLPTPGLWSLRAAILKDDPRLLQGATTSPPPLQSVQEWPVEACDAIGFCHWMGKTATVGETEEFFARTCYLCDEAMGEPAECRHWLNWYDDTPRGEMLRELLAEVDRVLCERMDSPLHLDAPAGVLSDWVVEHAVEDR